jgi:hypothetical protein
VLSLPVCDHLGLVRQFLLPVPLCGYGRHFQYSHDLKILQEIFAIKDGNYVRENAFWTSHSIIGLISELDTESRTSFLDRVKELVALYAGLSDIYQRSKAGTDIPLS